MPALKVAFVVQGEGRGHMTQALALASILRDAGHEVTRALVGRSPCRAVPEYFARQIGAPVESFEAPAQVAGADGRALSVGRTLADAARRSPGFARALGNIPRRVADADLVVNFLDLLSGLGRLVSRSGPPVLGVAHNHLFTHPALPQAPGPAPVRRAVLAYARATSLGAAARVALSFDQLPHPPSSTLRVAPPLLRRELFELDPTPGSYLLAYALNPGYGTDLAAWQRRNPAVELHCYLERGAAAVPGPSQPTGGPGFHVHDLDGTAFLRRLAGCRAYVGSAGFESLCEAHWLGKPVLAVPTEGQFEQTLNAWDAERCGVARSGSYADLDAFWAEPGAPEAPAVHTFRRWVARAPAVFVDAVERAAHIVR